MDPRKYQFLTSVVGDQGAKALVKAIEYSKELDTAIFPRVVLAWLDVMARFGHDGFVPGMENTKFTFEKNEIGFSGFITLEGDLHKFENTTIDHVAGCIAVALGLDNELIKAQVTPQKLAKLGKSIDLLVKSRVAKAKLYESKIAKESLPEIKDQKRINLPGQSAPQHEPEEPVPPTLTQPKNLQQVPEGAVGTAAKAPIKLPKKKVTAAVTKSESMQECSMCGQERFSKGKFIGCICFKSLAKNIETKATKTGYILEFTGLDEDEIGTVIDGLKGK